MPGRARRWTIAVVAMVLGVLGMSAILPAHATTGDVTYVLAWDADGVTRHDDGSWTTTNDLGYEVTVAAGALSTYTVTMVSCPHGHGLLSWLFGMFGPGVAMAGHTSSGEDPALVGGPVLESLVDVETIELGVATVHEPAYCEAHTNWGTLDPTDPTLVVTGSWIAPDGSSGDLSLETTIDWGVKDVITDGSTAVHVEPGTPARVEIRRHLATMFDGVDFATDGATDQALGVLRALAHDTTFVVTSGTFHQ